MNEFRMGDGGLSEMKDWEKEQVLQFCKGSSDESARYYSPLRRRWYVTERYVEGLQLNAANTLTLTKDTALDYFSAATALNDVDEEYFVDNILLPRYLRLMSRLTRYQPNLTVWPNSLSQKDQEACRIARILLFDILEKNGFTQMKIAIAENMLKYGNAFIRTTWNNRMGEPMQVPSGEIKSVLRGVNPMTGEPVYEDIDVLEKRMSGDVELRVVHPRKVLVSRRARNMKDLDWIEEGNILSIDNIWRTWGIEVKAEALAIEHEEFSAPSALNYGQENQDENSGTALKSALVRERWVRPCPMFPKGAKIAWCNETILACSALTDHYDDIPYTHVQLVPQTTSFWGDTPLYHALPHQDEINRLESQIMRHTKLTAAPKLICFPGTKIPDEKWDDSTGEIIQITGEKAPVWSNAPEIPQGVYENLNRVCERMDDILSSHDVSIRSGVSGATIASLQEIDESNYTPAMEGIADCWNGALSMALKVAADYIKAPRMIRMTNRDQVSIVEFDGTMLNNNFSVHVDLTGGLPVNKIARYNVIYQAVDKGILTPEKAGRYLEFGEFEEALRQQNEDRIVAEVAVRNMIDSEGKAIVPVHEWDNHAVHLEVIESYLKRYYDSWPPLLQARMKEKMMLHKHWLAAATMPGMPGAGVNPASIQSIPGGGLKMPQGGLGVQKFPPSGLNPNPMGDILPSEKSEEQPDDLNKLQGSSLQNS